MSSACSFGVKFTTNNAELEIEGPGGRFIRVGWLALLDYIGHAGEDQAIDASVEASAKPWKCRMSLLVYSPKCPKSFKDLNLSASSLRVYSIRLLLLCYIILSQGGFRPQQDIDKNAAPPAFAPQRKPGVAAHYFEALLVFVDDTVHLQDVFYKAGRVSGQNLHVGDNEFTLTALDSADRVVHRGYFKDPRVVYYDIVDSASGGLTGGMITRDSGIIALRMPYRAGETIEYRILNPDSTTIWESRSTELLKAAQRKRGENRP